MYNLVKQELAKKLVAGSGSITSLAVHRSGDHLLLGSQVGLVKAAALSNRLLPQLLSMPQAAQLQRSPAEYIIIYKPGALRASSTATHSIRPDLYA